MNYYRYELNKLDWNNSNMSFKVVDHENETKWLSLNADSAKELISFLQAKFPTKDDE